MSNPLHRPGCVPRLPAPAWMLLTHIDAGTGICSRLLIFKNTTGSPGLITTRWPPFKSWILGSHRNWSTVRTASKPAQKLAPLANDANWRACRSWLVDFWGILNTELYDPHHFEEYGELCEAMAVYNNFYNNERYQKNLAV